MLTRSRLKAALLHGKVPALLVSNLTNIRYLTGMDVSAGIALVRANGTYAVYLDTRYVDAARLQARCKVFPIADLPSSMRLLRRCGVESHDVTLQRFARWKAQFKSTKLVHTSGLIEGLRRDKNPEEIKHIRHALKITKAILRDVPTLLVSGRTERDLAWRIQERAHGLGAEGLAFETIVGFGENTAEPHHHCTGRRFRPSDLVQIDMGVRVRGYCSDMSRVYALRALSPEEKKSLRALTEAKKAAEKMLHSGVSTHALDRAAREVLARYELQDAFTHSLGHGVGLDIHEGVTLSQRAPEQKILRHEVVTIEPGVYFPGRYGMRIEDTYIVER